VRDQIAEQLAAALEYGGFAGRLIFDEAGESGDELAETGEVFHADFLRELRAMAVD